MRQIVRLDDLVDIIMQQGDPFCRALVLQMLNMTANKYKYGEFLVSTFLF